MKTEATSTAEKFVSLYLETKGHSLCAENCLQTRASVVIRKNCRKEIGANSELMKRYSDGLSQTEEHQLRSRNYSADIS